MTPPKSFVTLSSYNIIITKFGINVNKNNDFRYKILLFFFKNLTRYFHLKTWKNIQKILRINVGGVIDIPFFYLEDIIPKDKLNEIMSAHQGCRIYIPKKQSEYNQQKERYKHLIKIGYSKENALLAISEEFGKTKQTISKHVQKGLFDD